MKKSQNKFGHFVNMCVYLWKQNKKHKAMTHNVEITKTFYKSFINLRAFDVEYAISNVGCIANITENGVSVWTIYAHTEKTLKSQVTKWCKENWF